MERPAGQEAIRNLFVEKLRHGDVGNLIRILLSDPETRELFLKLHQDRGVFLPPDQWRATPGSISAVLTTLMRDPALKDLVVDSMVRQMFRDTKKIKAAIEAAVKRYKETGKMEERERAALVYDEVVLGGGIHAAIFNMARTVANPSIKSLTMEAGEGVSANFHTKSFLQVNTTNSKQYPGELPNLHLRKGNQNYMGMHAPVQVPYIVSERFPTASLLSDVATANQYLTSSDTAFHMRVARVIRPSEDPESVRWPARYKILLSDGTFVFSRRVIFDTGAGEAVLPKDFDQETLRIIANAQREAKETGQPPGIMTYEDLAGYLAESKQPLRPFSGRTIDVAGGGDSGATVIQFLLRLAKNEVYKEDVAQVGDVKHIHWVNQDIGTRAEYLRLLKHDRYSDIAVEMPNPDEQNSAYKPKKKIEPISGHIVQIRISDKPELGRYRVIRKTRDGAVQEGYTDFVIVATGYKQDLHEILGYPENPFDDEQISEAITAPIADRRVLPIAVKVRDEELYAVGPASMGRVLYDAELSSVAQSPYVVSTQPKDYMIRIAAFAPRDEALAEKLAGETRDVVKERLDLHDQPILMHPESDAYGPYDQLHSQLHAQHAEEQLLEVRLKKALGDVLHSVRFPEPFRGQEMMVSIERDASEPPSVRVRFKPSLPDQDRKILMAQMYDECMGDLALTLIGSGRWCQLDIHLPISPTGSLRIPEMNVVKISAIQQRIRQRRSAERGGVSSSPA